MLPSVTLIGLDCINLDRLVIAADICRQNFDFAEVKLLTSLPSNRPEIVPINPVLCIEDYSYFVISEMHRYIHTAYALVIQHDGFILNPDAWSDKFLEYDYIGAPWPHLSPDIRVGNGGFSLRSKKLMELTAQKIEENYEETGAVNCHPEDLWICRDERLFFESFKIRFAPEHIAKKFSFEGDWRLWNRWNGQFGFHGGKWNTDISRWIAKNRDYRWNRFTGRISKK